MMNGVYVAICLKRSTVNVLTIYHHVSVYVMNVTQYPYYNAVVWKSSVAAWFLMLDVTVHVSRMYVYDGIYSSSSVYVPMY